MRARVAMCPQLLSLATATGSHGAHSSMEAWLLLGAPTEVLETATGVGYGGREVVWLMDVAFVVA